MDFSLLPIIYFCVLLFSCLAQRYELQFTRDIGSISNPEPWSNILTLRCWDKVALKLSTNPMFWLNDTELRERLGLGYFTQDANSLTFQITQELEGSYSCGPDKFSISIIQKIVAYPLSEPSLLPRTQRVILNGTDTVTLPPLVSPGALVQQYFIDWQNARTLQTLARIQGPRNLPQMEQDQRFSVNPDTFALIISPVRFEDRGSYLGVVGVVDPAGGSLTYTQTKLVLFTLEFEDNPEFFGAAYEDALDLIEPTIISSPVDKMVSSSSTTFTCRAKGYPQPVIIWLHNDAEIDPSSKKYSICNGWSKQKSDGTIFIVKSTLIIMDISSLDSGNVTCIAEVRSDGGYYSDERMSQLSVFGECPSNSTLDTYNSWESVKASPQSQGSVVKGLDRPLQNAYRATATAIQYAVPLGIIAAVFAVVFIFYCYCRRQCLRKTITQDDLKHDTIELQGFREGQVGSSKDDEINGGSPDPRINDSSQSTKRQCCLQFCCYETEEERGWRKILEKVKRLFPKKSAPKQSV